MKKNLISYRRNILYFNEFISNLCKYFNNKIYLPKLQIWVGQTCTLRCKNCSQLFPYIKQRIYDIDKVIKNTKKVLKHCEVESLHIIGGEPFTNKNIAKLIEFIAVNNPKKDNKIVSNGTIIPSDDVIKILKKYRDDIFITVSEYDCAKERQAKFVDIMRKNDIRCEIISLDVPWYYCGDDKQKEIINPEDLKRNFDACWDRTCYTIADKELSICPRMHNSPFLFPHAKKFIENLPIKFLGNNLISKALIATCLTTNTYREACKYCYGVSGINNLYCTRGEQLE